MSDSDDDWFSKDVDEMVQEVKRKSQTDSTGAGKVENLPANDNHQVSGRTPLFYDPDYGGNYAVNVAEPQAKSKSGGKKKRGKGEVYVHKISGKKLKYISELRPQEAFLEVYQADCGFFECFNEPMSVNDVRLIIIISSKLCQLPLEEFGRDFLTKFIESTTLVENIKKLLADETYPSDVVDKVLTIGWKVESLGLQCPTFIPIIDSLCAKNFQHYSIRKEIKGLSVALRNERTLFTEIYPTLEEITQNEEIVVKPNIIKGKYPSVEEYIHTHLSLLREDFVAPLREFIGELKAFESIEEVPFKRVYKATRFLPNDFLKSSNSKGLAILVDLMPNERSDAAAEDNKTPWINPKKLMYGTLLCFTTSLQFTDLILAVVSHRDVDNLVKGYVHVEIVRMYNIANVFERDFIMFENEVYFEPYHHVYRVLRSLHENNFPLRKYLVQVEPNSEPPEYLKGSTSYAYKHKNFRFNPLDIKTYPSPENLQLDESQYAAFQHSLSRKFSLIQGPPGTGKTFIGLKIVSALLENVDSRVLVVCYTNHALDQFLSGILNSTTEIVRLGSQSKHEHLDEYNIKQISDGGAACRNLRTCYYNAKVEYTKLMEEFDKLQMNKDCCREENYQQILKAQSKLRKSSAKLAELKQMFEYHLVKRKKVIGMTTTYASRSNLLLQLLKVPIVIVEEAAEVLEAHIVAAITQYTEHVILIGDHQQLRPTTSVYRLSQKFNMDISLFERMINNNLNCVCLNTQHRMRPEIANLIRPTIYKDLKDSESVGNYGDIRGMANNLFFVNHDMKEVKSSDETTKRNPHEVKFLLCLASYLLLQNYKPEDIVILCTYNGQMFDFFNERRNHPHLEKVRITVVDNFQGEESKIILLSLVRNNNENKIGYLAMPNRICVALSRAQAGFYVVGAINFLARNNRTWQEIRTTLEKQNAIGDMLPLKCIQHGIINPVRSADDFVFIEKGMCSCKL